jgi:metal-sulfur cluster biosynthetic enzyme
VPVPCRDDALIRKAWQVLAEIQDMEIPVSIVDLGMVRDVRVADGRITVDLTFTSMGSPGIEWTQEDVRTRLEALQEVDRVEVNVVWSPPWTAADLTPRGREALRALGVMP